MIASNTRTSLLGKLVLVTGGTGFIGGRLVERLVQETGAHVRILARDLRRTSGLARFPVEIVEGDVTVQADVERAAHGCQIIMHCAYGNSGDERMRRRVNVGGTRNVLDAALRVGATRIIHLSTLVVYGMCPEGDIDEETPRRYSGNGYADSKLDAEKLALAYVHQHGLPVTVIQPTAVYGPYAPVWTTDVLNSLREYRVLLVDDGHGICNAVYIDDLVSAMLLAATRENAVGEAFLISGETPITWRDFFTRFERMLGVSSTVGVSQSEAIAAYHRGRRQRRCGILSELLRIVRDDQSARTRVRNTREVDFFLRAARAFTPQPIQRYFRRRTAPRSVPAQDPVSGNGEKPLQLLSPPSVRFFAAKPVVRIEKAKRLLGYCPVFNFERGADLTERWARWANLLD